MFLLNKKTTPLLKWAGGKSSLLPQLTRYFPEKFSRYIEPFLGAGSVFFSLEHSGNVLLNDVNPELIHLYETVRDYPLQLCKELDGFSQKYSEEFYYDLRKNISTDPVARAARTLFLNKSGYNGLYRLNSNGSFNVPFGKRPHCPKLYDLENIKKVSIKLKTASLHNESFEKLLSIAQAGDFVYCDPPYAPVSPTSAFTSYTSKGFTKEDQVKLKLECENAVARGAFVAVSNSNAPFIRKLYERWNVVEIKARRAINSKGEKRGELIETLSYLGYAT
jgi:DNA adenine methylase